jgi:tetratricopeptide (TPR) repeat protein
MDVVANLQPYATLFSALMSVALIGLLVNILNQIRQNAAERHQFQNDQIKDIKELLANKDDLHKREKEALTYELNELKAKLEKQIGITNDADLVSLALSSQKGEIRTAAASSVESISRTIARKIEAYESKYVLTPDAETAGWRKAAAAGAFLTGSVDKAIQQLDRLANQSEDWDLHFSRGVAYANMHAGRQTNIAALRAYSDAIALAPEKLESHLRARLFTYRGAMLKRLGRPKEAESDLIEALSLTDDAKENLDTRYNLACVYSQLGRKSDMLAMIAQLNTAPRYMSAIVSHLDDYFAPYKNDPDFRYLVQY